MRRFLLFPAVLFLVAFTPPAQDGFVTDLADILSADEESSLEQRLIQYQTETSNEIAILTVPTLDGMDIAQFAIETAQEWGVGSKEFNNGIMILVAMQEREIFIATGYGLEGALPDLAAKQIIDNEITPAFRDGLYVEGFSNAIDAISLQIKGEYSPPDAPQIEWAPIAIVAFVFVMIIVMVFYQFLLGIIVHLSPSRSWKEGAVIGGMFGFFAFSIFGLVLFAVLGAILDAFVSWLFVRSPRYQAFIKRARKKMKNRSSGSGGFWSGGSGGSSGGGSFGGGSFGGGSFGGGGARGGF